MTTFGDRVYELGGSPVGFTGGKGKAFPQEVWYVDALNGSDSSSGKTTKKALATIQAAVNLANISAYALMDVDIYVLTGSYTESVRFSRGHLTSSQVLWDTAGINCGRLGKIRLIAVGYVQLNCGASGTKPTIEIERPNVEIHDFELIYMNTSETVSAGNWTTTLGDGTCGNLCGMPAIYIGDNYNGTTLNYAAANQCLVSNCRVNGGGVTGGNAILLDGTKQVHVSNCIIEYGVQNGIRCPGTSKGSGAENIISGCIFNQNTIDVFSQAQITNVITNCIFMATNKTNHLSNGTSNSLNIIHNCSGDTEDKFEDASGTAGGWSATMITTHDNGGPSSSNDLTGDSWKSGASIS